MSDKKVIIPLIDAIDIFISIQADKKELWCPEEFLLDYFPIVSEDDIKEYLRLDLIHESVRPLIEDAVIELRMLLRKMDKYATEENPPRAA